MEKLRQFFKKVSPVIISFIVIAIGLSVVFYVLDHSSKDNDQVLLERIESLQKEYDKLWSTKGKELLSRKQELYKEQESLEVSLKQFSDNIQQLRNAIGNKNRLKVWEPANEKFYKENKDTAKYRIIKEGVGGAEANTGSGYIFEYRDPSDLFYTCHKLDKCYVTQGDTEHVKNNGYIATDIGTGDRNVPVRLPDYMGKEVVYTLKYVTYPRTTGKTVEAFGEVDGVKFMWRIGHLHWDFNDKNYESLYHNKQLKTGTIIGYSGGESEKSFKNGGDQGATTGKHVHIEYLIWDGMKYMPTFYRITSKFNKHVEETILPQAVAKQDNEKVNDIPSMFEHTYDEILTSLINTPKPHSRKQAEVPTNNKNTSGDKMFPRVVYVTTFNAEVGQTDDDPTIGAAGTRIKKGDIALSRDLLFPNSNLDTGYNSGSPIKLLDKVKVTSLVPGCNGVFTVTDSMARRFKNRVDIFKENRSENTSCWGIVEKVE